MQPGGIDSFLTNRNYRLVQHDSSAGVFNRYYTSVVRKDDSTMIRSFTWTKATTNNYEGVLILYRTYDEHEQEGFVNYIRANNFKLSQSYKTSDAEEFLYTRDELTIRNSISVKKLENNREVKSFSIETGK